MSVIKEKTSPQLIGTSGDSLREAFGKSLVKLAEKYPNFVVLDADVAGGTGVHHFRSSNPDRFYQCGIAEQNMMGTACGMARTGLIPFVTTFAVFQMRAIEQVRLSAAYTNSNVKIIASHVGLDVGPDGASAQALEDLAMFRSIPNMTIVCPADAEEMFWATKSILEFKGPVYMRTGRSPAPSINHSGSSFEIGKGSILKEGSDLTIISCGVQVARSLEAADILYEEGINARVVNMSTIKPIDKELITSCAQETGCFVTSEDHNILGGLGGAVAEVLSSTIPCPIEFVGVKDVFGESGEPKELSEKYGLQGPNIAFAAKKVLSRKLGKKNELNW